MVCLLPDEDQIQIVDVVSRFLSEELPVARLHVSADARQDELVRWKEIAGLGYLTLGLPEEHGGGGLSLAEEVLIFRELGRSLISPAVLATVMAGHLAQGCGDGDLCGMLVAGSIRAAPAIADGSGGLFLFDAKDAELALVLDGDELRLYDTAAFGKMKGAKCLDDSVSLTLVDGPLPLPRLACLDIDLGLRWRLLIAGMQIGIADRSRDMAVDYATMRMQFGKPIGSFQAVKHRCADMALRCEMAFAQMLVAAVSQRDRIDGGPFHTASAALLAGRAATENSAASIQLHGGIGFTAEHDAHLFLKRANLLARLDRSAAAQSAAVLAEPLPV